MNGKVSTKTFLIIAGALFLIASIVLVLFFVSSKKPEGYIEITGTIERITENRDVVTGTWEHHVFVNYVYEGVKYSNIEIDSYSGTMLVGQTIQLFMNPNNPMKVTTQGNAQLATTMLVSSIVMYSLSVVSLGGTLVYKIVKKKKSQNQ